MVIHHEIIAMVILSVRWFKKVSYQLLAEVCAQVLFNCLKG